jgi:hypothetical protein
LASELRAARDFLKIFVAKNDLEAMPETHEPQIEKGAGDTGAAVIGMITESEISKIKGTPRQSGIVRGSHGDAYVHSCTKRRPQRKAIVPAFSTRIDIKDL